MPKFDKRDFFNSITGRAEISGGGEINLVPLNESDIGVPKLDAEPIKDEQKQISGGLSRRNFLSNNHAQAGFSRREVVSGLAAVAAGLALMRNWEIIERGTAEEKFGRLAEFERGFQHFIDHPEIIRDELEKEAEKVHQSYLARNEILPREGSFKNDYKHLDEALNVFAPTGDWDIHLIRQQNQSHGEKPWTYLERRTGSSVGEGKLYFNHRKLAGLDRSTAHFIVAHALGHRDADPWIINAILSSDMSREQKNLCLMGVESRADVAACQMIHNLSTSPDNPRGVLRGNVYLNGFDRYRLVDTRKLRRQSIVDEVKRLNNLPVIASDQEQY